MSGIGGMMQRAGSPSDYVLSSLAQSLHHRGPDSVVGEVYNEVGFVYTRLSIIDLEGGGQPLHGNNLSLIANAEIYNSLELREAFPSYHYKTQSDCEIILPLYQKYGAEFANHLRGMYALALYDAKTKTLYLSRDPFGIKSLYYWEGVSGLAFSSEPHAILNAQIITPQLNYEKLYSLISFNYTWGRETLFQNIYRVMPGETLVIRKGQIIKRILREALPMGPPHKLSLQESLLAIDKAIDNSVEVHLRSEVPYGVFLSGDIDSFFLLKFVSHHSKEPIKTFSISLPGQEKEREKTLNLSKALNTNHQDISFDENDFWTLLPKIMKILDDPTLDALALLTYKVAEFASKSVKVLLSGEGGSELFGGQKYDSFLKPWWLGGGSSLPKDDRLKNFDLMKFDINSLWKERDELIFFLEKRKLTHLQTLQAIDIASVLPNDLLLKLDRCLMAHGVEGRTPFLDTCVVDAAFNLSDKLKFKDKMPQWILREWLQQNSPEILPFLIQKQPSLPVGEWIYAKGKEIGPLVAQQEGIAKLCNPLQVEKLFLSNQTDSQNFSWGLLCFSLWHQIHILRIPPQEDVIKTLTYEQLPSSDDDL